MKTDLEREYLQEIAYIKAQKDTEEWQQWEEEQRKLQKPAKIEVVYEHNSREIQRIDKEWV